MVSRAKVRREREEGRRCVYKGEEGKRRRGRTGIWERRDQPQWQAGPLDWR